MLLPPLPFTCGIKWYVNSEGALLLRLHLRWALFFLIKRAALARGASARPTRNASVVAPPCQPVRPRPPPQSHTILLIQTADNQLSRTYLDFPSPAQAWDTLTRMFEARLKELTPGVQKITYDVQDLFRYLDNLHDVSVMMCVFFFARAVGGGGALRGSVRGGAPVNSPFPRAPLHAPSPRTTPVPFPRAAWIGARRSTTRSLVTTSRPPSTTTSNGRRAAAAGGRAGAGAFRIL